MFRRLFAAHLAGLMLLAQIGVPVYTHLCAGKGKTWVSAFVQAKTCCSRHEARPRQVCHPPAPLAHHESDIGKLPCCRDYVEVIGLQAEFVSDGLPGHLKKLPGYAPASPAIISPAFHRAAVSERRFTPFQPHPPPLRLYGRRLLVFEQIFRC